MNSFQFGLRQSSAGSVDDNHSRYVPSSIYSGPGPAEESPVPNAYVSNGLRNPFQERQSRFTPLIQSHTRSSSLLNISDPIAMHLLMETAIGDSKEFEILSFEELEQLKKERTALQSRADAIRRKLALESKLRDAAQSLNRLYSTRAGQGSTDFKSDTTGGTPPKKRRSLLGSKGSNADALGRAEDEFAASNRKIEELTQESSRLDLRLEELQRRILEHTAGILQMTHRGLKKNLRKPELPRSPESMASQTHHRASGSDGIDDFDERSLYYVPDYANDFGSASAGMSSANKARRETQAIDDVANRLNGLVKRLHVMIMQAGPSDHVVPPPDLNDPEVAGRVGAQIQAHLGYMSQGLDAIEVAQARSVAEAQKTVFDSEDQLEDVNVKLHDMLERTNSISHSPMLVQDEARGKDLQSQLAFSTTVLDRLNSRVQTLVDQKDILTRQVQQQRELNTKSDAQRDAQIRDLADESADAKRLQAMAERETHHAQDQMSLLLEQLDRAKQDGVLREQQMGMNDSKAVEAERNARKESEANLLADIQSRQDLHTRLQADFAQLQNEMDSRSQKHVSDLNELSQAKQQSVIEVSRHQAEAERIGTQKAQIEQTLEKTRMEMGALESEVVRCQTELTLVKAELDGAYGTRAQRAADVSMNPAVQKEIDDLNLKNSELSRQLELVAAEQQSMGASAGDQQDRVNALQKELRDTIEDYELMTKASIEFEKERDQLEATIDAMRERSEAFEAQLSEEKVKWLGAKNGTVTDSTSTMVLKNEFKKMMRDTRAENIKALRAEQDERRRLESVIRSIKKDMSRTPPSKPTHVQTVTANPSA